MNKNLPTPPKNKLSFGKALLLMMAVCTTYALLIPENVLTRFPALTGFTTLMESLFPAIGGFAKNSPIPEVVRLYYSTMWLGFPIMLYWALLKVESISLQNPSRVSFLISVGAGLFLALLAGMEIYLLGFNLPNTDSLKPALTGGRGNLLFIGLTNNAVSIGISTAISFWAAGIALCASLTFFSHSIKRK